MEEFFYHGIWRMDWGFGNPNKTAAFIAILMIAVLGFTYIHKWGFWIALVLFTVLGIGLVHTFSRGGVIALVIGLVPVIYFSPRSWAWNRIVGAVLSISIMIGCSIYLDAQERYEQGFNREDRSITNRLQIWKVAPQMMVDAPYGWGIGNSGRAYMEWYQPLDQSEKYRTLINSHLTWLVELGWPARFLYILTWLSIILLCWPSQRFHLFSISLGVWIAFAVAATFSSVAESLWLWIVPSLVLFGVLVIRIQKQVWLNLRLWTIPVAVSCLAILILALLGSKGMAIHAIDGSVVLGKGEPETWVVVNGKVMGDRYGHALRSYLSTLPGNHDSVGVVPSVAQIPGVVGKTVVIAGSTDDLAQAKSALTSARRIILLNPSFLPQEIGATKESSSRFSVLFGEFSQSVAINAWVDYGALKRIEGSGDFLPHWPEIIFDAQ